MSRELLVVINAPLLRGAELSTLEYIRFLRKDFSIKVVVGMGSVRSFIDQLRKIGVDISIEYFNKRHRYSIVAEDIIKKYVKSREDIIWFPHIGQPLPSFSKDFMESYNIIGHIRDYTILCPIVFSRYTSKCSNCSYLGMLKCKNWFNYNRYINGYIDVVKFFMLTGSSLLKTYQDYRAISYAKNIIRLFKGIIAISKFLKQVYQLHINGLNNRFTVIYNPVFISKELINISIERHYKKEDYIITYASGFDYTKGFHVLINAIGIVLREFKNLKLILLGEYNNRTLAIIKRRGLEKNVLIAGYRPHSDVLRYFARSDVVVIPTIAPEPFGRIAAEANMLGVPVVASNIGGLPEIVEDGKTGFLVKPGDPIELAKGIIRALEYNFDREYIHKVTYRKFNPQKIRQNFIKYIDKIAS